MERGTDRATLIVVFAALPLLVLSAAIVVAALVPRSAAGPVAPLSEPAPPAASAVEPSSQQHPAPPAAAPPIEKTADKAENSPASPSAEKVKTPGQQAAEPAAIVPLADFYDRAAYNALQELKALIESQAWVEAGRLVTAFDSAQAAGIAPWVNDSALAVSLPVAAELAHVDFPQIRAAFGEQFETLATLRIAAAIRRADAQQIALATAQFLGAKATADAHTWLADEALAQGKFLEALAHYRKAAAVRSEHAASLDPKIRLAAAMAGQDTAAAVAADVTLGQKNIAAANFERLIAEMLSRAQDTATAQADAWRVWESGVSRAQTRVRGDLAGFLPVGPRDSTAAPRARALVSGAVAYIASAQHVAAFAVEKQRLLWRSEASETRHSRATDANFPVARPIVQSGRVFVRLLREQEPRLCCLDAAAGKLLWTAGTLDGQTVLSEPVFYDGRLMALAARKGAGRQRTLTVCQFDAASGQLIREQDLLPLDEAWDARTCHLSAAATSLIARIGPLTLGIDAAGSLQWVRSDSQSRDAGFAGSAVVFGEHGFLTAAAGQAVVCFESRTGRVRWNNQLENLRVAGATDDVVVVESESDVHGLHPDSGEVLWRFATKTPATPLLVQGELVFAVAMSSGDDNSGLRLHWLGAKDGKVRASSSLADWRPADRVELIVPTQNRLLGLVSRERSADLQILELEPAVDAAESRF